MTEQEKAVALKLLEDKLLQNQKACKLAWPAGSPFLDIAMQKAAAVFEKEIEKILSN
ncbi:hypothetical protein LZP73_06255 [Shewanella sp. AS16]|uniref:hypothetical protein n=1 Tax=Shewanella sp. AS16 TaxID=2907625 RepID=UPI001F321377|nr:hypothetical protein [Shewanella sp. AS16]MCE9685819.1 hypothetical protein [Shewanella sp. AS16]